MENNSPVVQNKILSYRAYRVRLIVPYFLTAILIGILASSVVFLFHQAMYVLEMLFIGDGQNTMATAAVNLSKTKRVMIPIIGGGLSGLVLWLWYRFCNQQKRYLTDYIESMNANGKMDVIPCLVRVLASLLVVSSGFAIGREGAMIMLGALIASVYAQKFTAKKNWRLWVACGAASGMASAFNAPLAGSLFVAEVLFGNLRLRALGSVIIAAVTSALMTQLVYGVCYVHYEVIELHSPSLQGYGVMLLLGVLCGVLGRVFLFSLEKIKKYFLVLKKLPFSEPISIALGGLIVGMIALIRPEVYGNGYEVIHTFLSQPPTLSIVVLILACKLVAIFASSGSGAPGGVFTPMLFTGVGLGLIVGELLLMVTGNQDTYWGILMAITGMGAFLAATTHAPLMSALMVCEMTKEYNLIPGMLMVCVLSAVISRSLSHRSVYSR